MISRPQLDTIGDRIETGTYTLHSRFRRTANYTAGSRLITLSRSSADRGPLTITLHTSRLPDCRKLIIEPGQITIDSQKIPVPGTSIYDSRLPPMGTFAQSSLDSCRQVLFRESPPGGMVHALKNDSHPESKSAVEQAVIQRLKAGYGLILAGRVIRGARALRGVGNGLTPSGDDMIAGFMWGLHAVAASSNIDVKRFCRRILKTVQGENPISNQAFIMAYNGWFPAGMKSLVTALAKGNKTATVHATRSMISRGALSGSDICAGFLAGIAFAGTPRSTV